MIRSSGLAAFLIGILLVSYAFFSVAGAEEIRYDRADRRDPFAPLVGPYALEGKILGEGGISIEGIIFDPKAGSYALVGGQIYREGESVEGAKLVHIFPDRVILLQESEEIVIWLREEILQEGQQSQRVSQQSDPVAKTNAAVS